MRLWVVWALSLVALNCPLSASAQQTPMSPRTDACEKSESTWSLLERGVWIELCHSGGHADVAKVGRKTGLSSAANPPLSAVFLKNILVKDPYRSSTAPNLSLEHFSLSGALELESEKIGSNITLSDVPSRDQIEIKTSVIDGSLIFRNVCASVTATYSHFGLVSIHRASDYQCPPAKSYIIAFIQSNLAQLSIHRLTDLFSLKLSGSRIDGDASIVDSQANLLDLNSMTVGGQLDITGSTMAQQPGLPDNGAGLLLNGAKISSTVDLSGTTVDGPASISNTSIDGSLVLKGTSFDSLLDVSNTRIGKSIVFGSYDVTPSTPQKWGPNSSLSLVNSSVGVVDTPFDEDAWPPQVGLSNFGFSIFYGRPGLPNLQTHDNAKLGPWFKKWLARSNLHQVDFNPQPYETVSRYLASVGQDGAAQTVGVEAKDIERRQACSQRRFLRCALLWTSKFVIVYGYEPWIAVFWVIGFIVVGAIVFRATPEAKAKHMRVGLSYSFDMLLPVVKLRDGNYGWDIEGPARYYFYVHKLMGWILGSFLVAAISGLTK